MKLLSTFFLTIVSCCFLTHDAAQASIEVRDLTVAQGVDFLNAAATQPDPKDATQDLLHLCNYEKGADGVASLIQRKEVNGRFYYQALPGKEDSPLIGVSMETVGRFCNWGEAGMPLLEMGFTEQEIQQSTEQGVYLFRDEKGNAIFERDSANPNPHFYISKESQETQSAAGNLSQCGYAIVVRSEDQQKWDDFKDGTKELREMSVAPSAQTSRNLTEKDKSNPSEDFLWDLVGLGEDALIMAAIAAVIFYVPFFVLDAMASDAGLPLATRFISLFYATDEVPTAAAVRSTVVATRASLGRFWISVVKWFQKIGRSCCNPLSWRARMGNFFRTF